MNVKEILRDYMALEAVKSVKNQYELVFKNSKSGNKDMIYTSDLLELIDLPNHPDYNKLFQIKKFEWMVFQGLKLNDSYLEVGHSFGYHYKKSVVVMSTKGIRNTSVFEDLKQFKDDYDAWLESYLDEISPALQQKIDTVLPKGFGKDDVNLLLNS